VYNIVIINCEIWDDNDPDTVSNIPEASLLLQSQNIMLTSDNGSGITGQIDLFINKNLNEDFCRIIIRNANDINRNK